MSVSAAGGLLYRLIFLLQFHLIPQVRVLRCQLLLIPARRRSPPTVKPLKLPSMDRESRDQKQVRIRLHKTGHRILQNRALIRINECVISRAPRTASISLRTAAISIWKSIGPTRPENGRVVTV